VWWDDLRLPNCVPEFVACCDLEVIAPTADCAPERTLAETLDLAALDRLADLEREATTAPWAVFGSMVVYGPMEDGTLAANRALTVALRNALPDLLRLARLGLEHERLAATLATLEADLDAALERAAMAQKRAPKGGATDR
jgi:hypothetical protein